MAPHKAPLATTSAATPDASHNAAFYLEGEYWTIAYAGTVFRLRDAKGLHCLAHLLTHPGQKFAAVELLAIHNRPQALKPTRAFARQSDRSLDTEREETAPTRDERKPASKSTSNPITPSSRLAPAAYRGAHAKLAGKAPTSPHAPTVSAAEEARVVVTKRIRSAVKKIAAHHPSLGHHLGTCIKTGAQCVYLPDPERPIVWTHTPHQEPSNEKRRG